jgi:hypothetical protein
MTACKQSVAAAFFKYHLYLYKVDMEPQKYFHWYILYMFFEINKMTLHRFCNIYLCMHYLHQFLSLHFPKF